MHELKLGDWPFYLLNAQHGKIKCVNDVMAAYRVHSDGIWSSLDNISIHNETIKAFNVLKPTFIIIQEIY